MKISTTWWVVIGALALVLIVGLSVWFALDRSGESTASNGEWSTGRVPAAMLPPMGTDEIAFEPAESTVLAAKWPGATDETEGDRVADLEVIEVQATPVPTASEPGDPWTATVRVSGDTTKLTPGAGFILPPGYPVHPDGLTGEVTAVAVEGDTTVLTLGEAPMEQIFTSLHIAYHDMVEVPTPVSAVTNGQADEAAARTASKPGAAAEIVPAASATTQGATSAGNSIVDLAQCEVSWDSQTPEDAPSDLDFFDAATVTVEITEVEVAFSLDISPFTAPKSSLQVDLDSVTGLSLSRGAEATCSLPDVLMSHIPLGATGVTLDLGPQLEIGVSAGGAFSVARTIHHSFGYAADGKKVTPFHDEDDRGLESEFSSVIEGHVSGGARAGLSFLSRGGGYFDVGPKVVVQLASTADTPLGKAERCLSSQVDFELGLTVFLDLWVKRWETEVFNLALSPLFEFANSCPSGVEPDPADPTALPSPTTPSADANRLDLEATWCSIDDPSECVRLADLVAEHPDGGFPDGTQIASDEATPVSFCASYDLGDDSCTMAATSSFRYIPPGVSWDCEAEARQSPFDFRTSGCEPDYTWAHDDRFPRLVRVPNHQHDAAYYDSVPMYRSTDIDSVRVQTPESTGPVVEGKPVDPSDYEFSINAPAAYYSFETPSGLHTCTIVPGWDDSGVGEVGCDIAFNDSVDLPADPFVQSPDGPGGIVYAVLTASGADFRLISDTSYVSGANPTVLPYGETISMYGVTCTTSEEGILCAAADHTMQLSSGGYNFDGN